MDGILQLIAVVKQPRSVLPTRENISVILVDAHCFTTNSGRSYFVAEMLPPLWGRYKEDVRFQFIDSNGFERSIPRTRVARVQLRS